MWHLRLIQPNPSYKTCIGRNLLNDLTVLKTYTRKAGRMNSINIAGFKPSTAGQSTGTRIDLTGNKYGKLTVIEFNHTDSHRKSHWLCKCQCGNHIVVRMDNFHDNKDCGFCDKKQFDFVMLARYIHKETKKIVKPRRLTISRLKSGKEKREVYVDFGEKGKDRLLESHFLNKYELLTENNDPRLKPEDYTPVGSMYDCGEGLRLIVLEVMKHDFLQGKVTYAVLDKENHKVGGGNCTVEAIVNSFKRLDKVGKMTDQTTKTYPSSELKPLFDPTKAQIVKVGGETSEVIELSIGQVWNAGSEDDFQPVRIVGFGLSFGETWVEYDWYDDGKRNTDTWPIDTWVSGNNNLVAQTCDTEAWEKGEFKPLDDAKPYILNDAKFYVDTTTVAQSKNRNKIKANEICQQAIETMIERGKTYDKDSTEVKDCPKEERSMGKTVMAFNALTGQSLSETQGWLFMAVLKMARSQQGEYKHDNFLDGTAYFALAGEAASVEQ